MSAQWFAIKTLYRSRVEGRPEKPDLYYDPDATLVEERILLIKAAGRSEAIRKAEREAKDYARRVTCYNPYNQKIITEYMGFFDIFKVEKNPADRTEIFSTTKLMSRKINDRKVGRIYIGKRPDQKTKNQWRKFLNRDYNPE